MLQHRGVITVCSYSPAGAEPVDDPEDISELRGRDGRVLWVDLVEPNFRHMPELAWHYGYGGAIGLMMLITIVGYLYFRRKGWL